MKGVENAARVKIEIEIETEIETEIEREKIAVNVDDVNIVDRIKSIENIIVVAITDAVEVVVGLRIINDIEITSH